MGVTLKFEQELTFFVLDCFPHYFLNNMGLFELWQVDCFDLLLLLFNQSESWATGFSRLEFYYGYWTFSDKAVPWFQCYFSLWSRIWKLCLYFLLQTSESEEHAGWSVCGGGAGGGWGVQILNHVFRYWSLSLVSQGSSLHSFSFPRVKIRTES